MARKYYRITELAKMLDTTVPKIKKVLKRKGYIAPKVPGRIVEGCYPPYHSEKDKFNIPSSKAYRCGLAHKEMGSGRGRRGPYQWHVDKIRDLMGGVEIANYSDNFTGLELHLSDEGKKYDLNIWYDRRYYSWSVSKNKRLVGKMWKPKKEDGWRLYSNYKAKRTDFDVVVEGSIPEVVSAMNGLVLSSPPPAEPKPAYVPPDYSDPYADLKNDPYEDRCPRCGSDYDKEETICQYCEHPL